MAETRPPGKTEDMSIKEGQPAQLASGRSYVLTVQRDLSLAKVAAVLKELEDQQHFVLARAFAEELDYDKLTELAKKGSAPDASAAEKAKNDPNSVPHAQLLAKYLLLFGLDDAKLGFSKPGRKPRVKELQATLRCSGEAYAGCPDHGIMDETTTGLFVNWLGTQDVKKRDRGTLGLDAKHPQPIAVPKREELDLF